MNAITSIENRQANAFEAASRVDERCDNPLIKVSKLAYLKLQREDLDSAVAYFEAFGLQADVRTEDKVYFRGISSDHHALIIERGPDAYLGFGMEAEAADDLLTLANHFNLSVTKNCETLGGECIQLHDPNGNCVEVCYGLKPLSNIIPIVPRETNFNTEKNRLNQTVRQAPGDLIVHKLGHTVFSVKDIKASLEWYQTILGMIVSDFQFLPDEEIPMAAFMRCNCADQPVDHHTIALAMAPQLGHLHSAFEVNDIEAVTRGNLNLSKKKYQHAWGIGRHTLGSQIFDYWCDPVGEIFEHYADGDLFDEDKKAGYHPFHANAQHQWGPRMSKVMTGEDKPLSMLSIVLKRLFSNDDLTFARMKKMLKAARAKG